MVSTGTRALTPLPDVCAGLFCPLCGGTGVFVDPVDTCPIRRCDCGTWLSWMWESEAEYEALYTTSDLYHKEMQAQEGQESFWRRDAEAMIAAQSRLATLLALFELRHKEYWFLDIGTATGAFPAIARTMGFRAFGYEPNKTMVEGAHQLGRTWIQEGGWRQVDFPAKIITMHDVFEHLTRPAQCVTYMHEILQERGVLVIEMPELGCKQYLKEQRFWKHLRPRQHVCLYTEVAARQMFERAGFDVVSIVRPLRGTLGKIAYYLQKSEAC